MNSLVSKMCAPIEGIKPRQISVKELISRANSSRIQDTQIVESPFSIAEPEVAAQDDKYDHLADLHKYGRRPHMEAVAGLLDNFYVDSNCDHLDKAIEIIKHLKSL